jgi:hypothetical protein
LQAGIDERPVFVLAVSACETEVKGMAGIRRGPSKTKKSQAYPTGRCYCAGDGYHGTNGACNFDLCHLRPDSLWSHFVFALINFKAKSETGSEKRAICGRSATRKFCSSPQVRPKKAHHQGFDRIKDEEWTSCGRIKIGAIKAGAMGRWVETKFTVGIVSVLALCFVVSLAAWLNGSWWSDRTPHDFEQCSEQANRNAPSEEERSSLIAQCDKSFAGRRKIGGGYTYYDFLQNRHFDIARPNPSPEELKFFDEQYMSYLDAKRQEAIAAALTEKNNQRAQTALAESHPTDSAALPGPPLQIAPANIPVPIARNSMVRPKGPCVDTSVSCNWTRFTDGVKEFFQSNAKLAHP